MRTVSLAVLLFAFWLGLSGHYTPFLIGVGLLVTALCVFLARRMGTIDAEGHPVHLVLSALWYVPWLVWQITKSALGVTKIILNPALPISPTMTRVRASQKTPIGVNVYANSITLTPGTVTVGVEGTNDLVVHAITAAGAIELEGGEMDKVASRFEGASA